MSKAQFARRIVFLSVSLLFLVGVSSGQNETATAVVDFDLTAGDQGIVALSGDFVADDIIKLEVRAKGSEEIIAHQFRLTFDNRFFQFNSTQSSVNGMTEDNILVQNGGSIFQNTFFPQLLEDPAQVPGDTTLLFAVALVSQTQAFSASGDGLMGVVALTVLPAFTSGTADTLILVNAKFEHWDVGGQENAVEVDYPIFNGTINFAPGPFNLLGPASGTTELVNWDDDAATFSWSSSIDPNSGDVVSYTIVSSGVSYGAGTDTVITLTGAQLAALTTGRGPTSTMWYVTATDGIDTTASSDTLDVVIWNNTVLQTIADAKGTLDASFIPSTLGDTVKIEGVISHDVNFLASSGAGRTSYYMQSGGDGINIFVDTAAKPFQAGDQVQIAGFVNQFSGLTEVEAADTSDVREVGTAAAPTPMVVASVADYLASPETYEGVLIRLNGLNKVSGTWPGAGSSASITMYDTDMAVTITLRIDSDTDIDGSPEPPYPIDLVGIGSQFDSAPPFDGGYQILPRSVADIVLGPQPPGAFTLVSPTDGASVTVTSLTQTETFNWVASVDPNGDPVSYELRSTDFAGSFPATANTTDLTGAELQSLINVGEAQTTRGWYVLASDGTFQTSSDTFNVTLVNTPPTVAAITGTPGAAVPSGTEVIFGTSASDPTNDPLTYMWYVDGALEKTGTGTDTTFTRTFTSTQASQAFAVKVVVSDDRLGEDSTEVSVTTSVREGELIPTDFALQQNFPNPFNPSTVIKFDLPEETPVRLVIYNMLGQAVRTLIADEIHQAGFYSIEWDGRDDFGISLSSGVYLYRVQAGDFVSIKKMVLLK